MLDYLPEVEIPAAYNLTFNANGREIREKIEKRLKDVEREIKKQREKIVATVVHPQLETILEDSLYVPLLHPMQYVASEEAITSEFDGEGWKKPQEEEMEASMKQKLMDTLVMERFHGLKHLQRVLELIARNTSPDLVYELTTDQMLVFGF